MLSCHGRILSLSFSLLSLVSGSGCYVGPDALEGPEIPPRPGPPKGRETPLRSPEIDALSPDPAPGGVEFGLRVTGGGFEAGAVVLADGVALPTTYVSAGELLARSGPRPRGEAEVVVCSGERCSEPAALRIGGAAPRLIVPPEVRVAEDEALSLAIVVADADDPASVRVLATGLPPGALWDEEARTLRFTPDFTQGGERATIIFRADDGATRVEASTDLTIEDTIRPPDPEIVGSSDEGGFTRYEVSQVTDDYLDSPGYAGRDYAAVVTVPSEPPPEGVAVRVSLHGIGTASPATSGSSAEIRIAPHDPDNTYWWGYSTSLPEAPPGPGGVAPDYTVRRVLHLVDWVLRTFPEADPARVYVSGSSMGGAGAMSMGLLRGRHFAYVDARLGQPIPRNHRPSRVEQLSGLWGAPDEDLDSGRGGPVWDFMDLTRALAESPEARDQFLFLRHGKDDGTIHFGAVVLPSPLTEGNFYHSLADARVGHFAVWDEGGHGPADPVLGGGWWSNSWAPVSQGLLRRDLAFPAMTSSSLDDDPGSGAGNGAQDWSANAGYAGDPAVPGDCGWDGDLAGALGRFLRWDPETLVDTFDRFEVALRIEDGEGELPPGPDYPSTGDRVIGDLPAFVDVTPRRTQAFRARPGELMRWSFGDARGEVIADEGGALTVPALPLTREWTTLVLRRDAAQVAAQ